MRDRNFDMNDVIKVLENHDRVKPVWNENAKCWNYDFRGKDFEGEALTIRVAPDDGAVILVTGF
jgi:hypothetical protein